MLYEAKQGTKSYEYIKSILDAEFEEYQAYTKRVEEAVGFEFEKYQGYQPNRTLTRVYEITAIWVPSDRFDTLDKNVWKKVDGSRLEDGYYVAIAPNKRSKQGKAIASVLLSYKSVANHFKVMKELEYWINVDYRIKPEPKYRPFKDAKECWQEMQKHQPFGWVKYADKYISISAIDSNNDYETDFDDYTFADGTPFGVKEDE